MQDQLAPGFLMAPLSLHDKNFAETVILLAAHDDTGALGFVVNKEASFSLHELLGDLSIEAQVKDRKVLVGGPVSPTTGYVLHRHEPHEVAPDSIQISATLSLSTSKTLLESCAHGEVNEFDLLCGSAGWGPGQLEHELKNGLWLHAGFDETLLFDIVPNERYAKIHERLGVSPWSFMNVKGGAQA